MHRARNLYLLIPLLSLLACDAPTTGPELDSELAATGTVDAVLTSGEDLEGPFGPLPVEYPFMPFPDGYRFKNYGGAGDWMLFLETFGNQVNIWSIFDQQYFNNAFIHKFAGGQCYGFSITAGMFHRGVFGPHPSEFQRGAETPFPIPRDTGTTLDEAIERHISKYHYFQYSPEIKEQRIGAFYAADAEPIIAAMEAAQADGWKDSWVLAFRGDRGGHAVNLLNVERTDDGATLTVYDNNFPFREDTNSPVFRKFYFGADEFTYSGWVVDVAAVYPVSPHERDFLNKWWGPEDLADLHIWMSMISDSETFVIHTDSLGRRTGQTASSVLDEIPDAFRVRSLTGAVNQDWIEPLEYYLPPGDYTVELTNPSTGSLAYQFFAGSALLSMATSGPGPAAGRVTVALEEDAFSFAALNPVENLQMRAVRALSKEEERALNVSGISIPADGSLRITSAVDVSGFNLTFEGAEMALGNLSLTEASPAGVHTLLLPEVQLLEGASLRIEPWDWDRITQMPVFARTLMLDGRVFLKAYNSTAMNLDELLKDMVASGAIPNRGIANSIQNQVTRAPGQALVNHLESLVADGVLSGGTADLILATAEAAAAGGVSEGRFVG